jgi:hypothetical protein
MSDVRARLLVQSLEDRITPNTYTVTNGNDQSTVDGSIPPGSFRDMLNQANANPGADTINFAAGVSRVDMTTTSFAVTDSVTINGPGVTIDGHGLGRVFNINGPGVLNVTLNGLTVTNGSTGSTNGAGIYTANENVTLNNCVITGNTTTTGVTNGGGIATGAYGNLTINNSTISGNATSGAGGGIYFRGFPNAQLVINNSTISGNAANAGGETDLRGGGGIFSYYTPNPNGFTITNSTISGNSAFNGGGLQAYYFYSTATIQNCTITNNSGNNTSTTAGRGAGGISKIVGGGTLSLISSIVAGNITAGPASHADISVSGGSLTSNAGRVNASFSAIGVDPGPLSLASPSNSNLGFGATLALGPLANNGGSVQTHSLGATSLAIDHGTVASGVTLTTDSRGQPRTVGNAPDIGAFESTNTLPVALSNVADVTAAGATSYTFTVTYVDSTGINVSTLGNTDILVTGPNSFSQAATFVSVDTNTNGSPRTATYRFTPPGGAWAASANGTYTASLQANEVMTAAGTPVAVPAQPVGSFRVLIALNLVVTNANDSGAGSLRDAITQTNAANTPDTITFDPTFFATPRTIALASQLAITDSLTITGPGAANLTLQPTGAATAPARAFNIDGTSASFNGSGVLNVSISGMTITGGHTNGGVGGNTTNDGGAILDNNENVTLNNMVITGNTAGSGQGGAIAVGNGGFIRLTNSTLSGNSASTGGGIYFLNNGGLLVSNSTISGNSAAGSGGGVYFYGRVSGGFTIRNSTITGNTAAGGNGGGIYLYTTGPGTISNTTGAGTITIQNSTITGNTAGNTTNPVGGGGAGGGGISQHYAFNLLNSGLKSVPMTMAITSSIISGNSNGVAPDISQPTDPRAGAPGIVNVNNSAIGNAGGFTVNAAGSANNLPIGTALNLGPLANNGGPTQTIALLAGSAAIDKGSNPANLTTDQRGGANARVVGAAADIGAFEVQATGSPATVTGVAVNAGQANTTQRSIVTNVTVTFNTLVIFNGPATNAFQLARTGPNGNTGNVVLAVDTSGSTATQTVAKLTFSGPLTEGSATTPSLIDGNYTLTVLSSGISVGLSGGDNTTGLFRLFGDVNGDKAVNGLDLTAFRGAFGSVLGNASYIPFLDFNGDGSIDGADLTQFRNRFGVILP